MPKKTLITGGAGFIGSNFVHLISRDSYYGEIVVLDKLTYAGNKENISRLLESGRVRFVEGDIADKKFVNQLFSKERFELAINFAAETHVDRSIVTPAIFVMTNIVGTHNLLEASKDFGVPRYHQISTDEVYGDLGDNSSDYFTENTPLAPNCPYAASKAGADLLVSSYRETYGIHATISRCSNNYGPYQFPEKLIPFFFQLAADNKPLPLYGDGRNVRDWLYVGDHCTAVDLIIKKGQPGEIYNIGGHNEKENRQIAEMILEFLGKPKFLIAYVEDRRAHDRRYAMDPSKIEKELGWKPKVGFEEGIARTFRWYEENKPWWKKLLKRNEKIDRQYRPLKSKNLKVKIKKAKLQLKTQNPKLFT